MRGRNSGKSEVQLILVFRIDIFLMAGAKGVRLLRPQLREEEVLCEILCDIGHHLNSSSKPPVCEMPVENRRVASQQKKKHLPEDLTAAYPHADRHPRPHTHASLSDHLDGPTVI
jgi:hypothetical protein